jgi:hypothetical protein
MNQKTLYIVSILLALCLVFGCATPPTEEMNNAIEAVTRAENDADAVLYGRSSLERARDALRSMQAEANSKRYDAARTFASEAIAAADRAIAEGQTGAARAREEAAALLASLKPMIEETGRGINSAKSAGLLLDYVELDQEFDSACLKTDQAEMALAGRQYQDALEKGRNARAELNDINQKLSNAVISIARKK